jgi:hypothetical protein
MIRPIVVAVLMLLPAAVTAGESGTWKFPPVQGWTVIPESTVYTPETLWEFINGAADLFVSYGFRDLHVAYYRAAPEMEIRAEVYRHSTVENAYGMYSQERSPENAAAPRGTEGYSDEGILNFTAGRWYVKLSAAGPVPEPGLQHVAAAIDSVLHQPRALPAGFALLPLEQRQPRSEQYIARDYLGYAFLSGVYVAQYGRTDGCQIFVIPKDSSAAARSVYNAFLRVAPPAASKGNDPFIRLKDPHHGPVDITILGNSVVGIIGCSDTHALRLLLLENTPKTPFGQK